MPKKKIPDTTSAPLMVASPGPEENSSWVLATSARMMPADTNPDGNIYGGGPPCDHVDTAGCIAAYTLHSGMVVTRRMEIDFISPIRVGDILKSFYIVEKVGTTSITIKVKLDAYRMRAVKNEGLEEVAVPVVTARLIYVALTKDGQKTSVDFKGTKRS